MAKKLFGSNIEPACQYCSHGRSTKDNAKILCEKSGVCEPYYHCRKYHYDPLRRIPTPHPVLPEYEGSQFSLDIAGEG